MKINHLELLKDWFSNFFTGYLPFAVNSKEISLVFIRFLKIILKIFTVYLNEGVKVIYKMTYVLLMQLMVFFTFFIDVSLFFKENGFKLR